MVGVEPEGGLGRGLGARFHAFVGQVKGDAAAEDGDQGLGVDLQPLGIERNLDAAGIPEAGVLGHAGVVRGLDKDLDVHRAAVRTKAVAHHLAHLDLAVIDRHTDVERTERLGGEPEMAARLADRDHRRHLQAGELFRRLTATAHVHADVGAGQDRAQAGDRAAAETRPDHPEAGLVGQVGLGLLDELGRDLHPVIDQADGLHLADLDIAVLDVGLAGLEPLGAGKGDGDGRPLLADRLHPQPGPDQKGDDGHDPDQRRPPPGADRGGRGAVGCGFVHCSSSSASQMRRGSKLSAANMVSTTTAAK